MFFFFKQKTAYEMRISDWSSDVCSSDLGPEIAAENVDVELEALVGRLRRRIPVGDDDAAEGVGRGQRHERHGVEGGAPQIGIDADAAIAAAASRPVGRLVADAYAVVADRKSTRLNSSHYCASSMPSSA